MKKLHISWFALIAADNDTCGRCSRNYIHLLNAIEKLKTILRPKGILPVLTTHSISEREFHSNRIHEHQLLIQNQTIEDWLPDASDSLTISMRCQEKDCQRNCQHKRSYEAISESLVIEACIRAADALKDEVLKA